MLKFKLKEFLLALGKPYPQSWIKKVCGFSKSKSYYYINDKQKSFNLKDLSELCYQLNCTPNDLLYWEPNAQRPLPPNHPLNTQLVAPSGIAEWTSIFKKLSPQDILELKKIAEEKIER